MLFIKNKNFIKNKKFLNNEYKKKVTKYVFINLLSKLMLKKKGYRKKKLPFLYESLYINSNKKILKYSKTKLIRQCLINNRKRGVTRKFSLSRSLFRNLLQFGLVPGYKKAVW